MNRTPSPVLTLAATALLGALLSACMPDARPDGPSSYTAKRIHLQELDRNRDGFLTREELDSNHRLSLEFATYDTDGDGRISDAEFLAYLEKTTD